jgi:ParB/RepB/Spo0J family partition protein
MTAPSDLDFDAERSGAVTDFGNLPLIGRERTLAFVPITKIIPSDTNPRSDGAYDSSRQYALRRSIERHGVLQPLVVQAYTRDLYRLVEGHRRYEAARTIGVKELPAIIVSSLSTVDELIVMWQIHEHREDWTVAEQLLAIQRLQSEHGSLSAEELAHELGINPTTAKERLRVLDMGPEVVSDVVAGALDFKAALHADQVAASLKRHRPKALHHAGGEASVRRRLLEKARSRRGVAEELKRLKADIRDASIDDDLISAYVTKIEMTQREVVSGVRALPEKRELDGLIRQGHAFARKIANLIGNGAVGPDLPNRAVALSMARDLDRALKDLRAAITS